MPLAELPGRLALAGVAHPSVSCSSGSGHRGGALVAHPGEADPRCGRLGRGGRQRPPRRHRPPPREEAVRFVADAGVILASSLDVETTLASVARLAVPRIADWCIVYMREEDGDHPAPRDRACRRRRRGRRRGARPLSARRGGRSRGPVRGADRADAAARRRLRAGAHGGRGRPRGPRCRAQAHRARLVPLRPAHRPRADARGDLAALERVRPPLRPGREGARRAAGRQGCARGRQRAPLSRRGAGGGERAASERAAPAPQPGGAPRQRRRGPWTSSSRS